MRIFVGGERREETGEGERARGVLESSFVFLFFGVEMQVKKPCPLLSSCFFIFLQIEKSLPSSYLATKLENLAAKFELGSRYGQN